VTFWGETEEKLNELGAEHDILLTITERISVPPVRFSAEELRTSNTSIVSKCFSLALTQSDDEGYVVLPKLQNSVLLCTFQKSRLGLSNNGLKEIPSFRFVTASVNEFQAMQQHNGIQKSEVVKLH